MARPPLPDFPLDADAGPLCAAFVAADLRDFAAAARHVCHLPYGRGPDRANFRGVLARGRGTCSTKHALLAATAREAGQPLHLILGIYAMSEANTRGVGGVLALHGLESIPEAHCVLGWGDDRFDLTRPGAAAKAPPPFVVEAVIEPEQIGAHKVDFHRRHLRAWFAETAPKGIEDFEALWAVREACIAALSGAR